MIYVLAGNPNSGKTTLFNLLTGGRQHVGNFPGVTVEKKTGQLLGREDIEIVDLPGLYSLNPYTEEERVAADFLRQEKYDLIINIMDAVSYERGLYLTLQLLELEKPVVTAMNMIDQAEKKGIHFDYNEMSEALAVPVLPISAAKNKNVERMLKLCESSAYNGDGTPPVWVWAAPQDAAGKYGAASQNAQDKRRALCRRLREEARRNNAEEYDMSIAIRRYKYIEDISSECVLKIRKKYTGFSRSDRIDLIMTHKIFAVPVFMLVMASMFAVTFGRMGQNAGAYFSSGMSFVFQLMEDLMQKMGVEDFMMSLVRDGIFAGIGSVLSFLPAITLLFMCLSVLEDSGYMARVAFIADRPLKNFGISGKAFVAMIVGFGCTVPAVMAARTLSGSSQQKMAVLLAPYMSCSARLPIYVIFAGAFFPRHAVAVIISLYVLGVAAALCCGALAKGIGKDREEDSFLLELPEYRMPSFENVVIHTWEKAKAFVKKAFTVIFAGTVLVWVFMNFSTELKVVQDSSQSILAQFGQMASPVFAAVGFGDWRAVTAVFTGFIAKESVISTMSVLMGCGSSQLAQVLPEVFSPLSAYCFMVFCLLYTPCIAAVTVIGRELGSIKYSFLSIVGQSALAWGVTFVIYHAGLFISGL